MTRQDFYSHRNGGGLRTARKITKCMQFGCYKPIVPGEQYFDTQEATAWPATKKICVACSEVEV